MNRMRATTGAVDLFRGCQGGIRAATGVQNDLCTLVGKLLRSALADVCSGARYECSPDCHFTFPRVSSPGIAYVTSKYSSGRSAVRLCVAIRYSTTRISKVMPPSLPQ